MKFISLDRRLLENFNWPLLLAMLGLIVFGLINLFSVSMHGSTSEWTWFDRQSGFSTLGLLGMAVVLFFDYHFLKRLAWPFYFFCLLLLLGVLFVGSEAGGAQRWLDLGVIRFQPSESIKISVVILLASYFSEKDYSKGLGFGSLLMPGIIILVPFALVLKQPDLGTALHLAATCLPMFLILKPRLEIVIVVLVVMVCVLVFVLSGAWTILLEKGILKEYQLKRIETFLDTSKDPTGAAWNTIQSQQAVGSGQLFGRGYLEGTQQKNGFLPVPETDFAFAALSEEWGFIGCLVVLSLYLYLISRGLAVARQSKDNFGGFLALGLSSLIFWQMIINVGMVTGLLPVVGIPLPFISYGGTSILINMFAISIILNVSMRRFMFQDDSIRQNPEVWKHAPDESAAKLPSPVPVRRLHEYSPDEPDFHPTHRLPHKEPWLKYINKKGR